MICFGDENIGNYDTVGNPAEYRGKSFTWQKGRQLASVSDKKETIAFDYDANGRRIQKYASGVRTKYAYAGNQLIREERGDENNIPYFGDDLVAGDNLVEGDGIVVDSINKSVLEYLYGHSGIEGFVYNGAKYYFRRNVQGDMTRIYAIDGSLTTCYMMAICPTIKFLHLRAVRALVFIHKRDSLRSR